MKRSSRPLDRNTPVFSGRGGGLVACLVLLATLGGGGWLPVSAAEFPVSDLAEFNAATASVQPGDTITLADGSWFNADLLLKAAGTASQPITLRAQTGGKVLLQGSSRLRIVGRHLVVQGLVFTNGFHPSGNVIEFQESPSSMATNCRLSDCVIVAYNPASAAIGSTWVALSGWSNQVDHCYFQGKANLGALLTVKLPAPDSPEAALPNFHRIEYNRFGPRPSPGQNGGETLRIGDSTTSFNVSGTVVEHNYFGQCSGDIEIISNKSCENVYRFNTFVDCDGALTFRHGNRCRAEGNYFFGHNRSATGGIRIMGEGHRVLNNYFQDLGGSAGRSALTLMQGLENSPLNGYFQVNNALVAFNTFVNCSNSLVIGLPATYSENGTNLEATLPPLNCTFANNVVWTTKNLLVSQRVEPINITWEGNIMFGTAPGTSPTNGILLADPLLVLDADALWRPGANSPALATAAGNYEFVTDDIKGVPRPAAKDVGADQQSADPPLRRPLTPADVGPRLPPVVSLSVPVTGATLYQVLPFTVRANASDPDGTVTRVEFLANGNPIATSTNAPHEASVSLVAGNYLLTAVATDNASLSRTSAPVNVTVLPPQPPSVTLLTPAAGGTFYNRATFTTQATASDVDGVVKQIAFFANGTAVGADINAPYAVSLALPSGDYALTAVATDNSSLSRTSAPVDITVLPPQPPSVSLNEPVDGADPLVGRVLHLAASASDVDNVVTRIEFFANDISIGTNTNAPYEMRFTPPVGTYVLRVVATDGDSLSATSAPVNVTVRSPQPPIVAITEPADAAEFLVGWPLHLTASASDPDRRVVRVQFFADGLAIGADPVAPFQASWTPVVGSHTLTAVAVDDDELTATSAVVTVTVTLPGVGPFLESNGLVVVEAEHFTSKTEAAGHAWVSTNNVPGFVGASALVAAPNSGATVTVNIQTNSPGLNYQVRFADAGTYKYWIRGWAASGSDDSVYLGVDGQSPLSLNYTPTGAWMWRAGAVVITNAGVHEINLWMREDGAYVDRLLLTTNTTFTPTNAGPAESPRSGDPTNLPPSVAIRTPADGSTFRQGAPIPITAGAADLDGGIAQVGFFVNGNALGTSMAAPYQVNFTPVVGEFLFTAVATDWDSVSTTSTVVALTIVPPPTALPALTCQVHDGSLTITYIVPPELEYFDLVLEQTTNAGNWTLGEFLFQETIRSQNPDGSQNVLRRTPLNQLPANGLCFRLAQRL